MPLFARRKRNDEPELVEPQEKPTLPPAPDDADGRRSVVVERDYLLSMVESLPPFGMSLIDAWGLALCEDIPAIADHPQADIAQVDGFAVAAQELKGLDDSSRTTLRIREDLRKVGAAVPVQAGDLLPEGADAVVATRLGDVEGDVLTVNHVVQPGDHVLRQGELGRQGEPLVHNGQRLESRLIGRLGMAGIDKVFARPRPRVVVISVGDDLVDIGRVVGPGQQPDTNSHLLAACAKADGAQVYRIPPAIGVEAASLAISDQIIRADLLITSGGVGGGREGLVGQAIKDLGLSDFAQVAMRPGGSVGFGLISEDKVPLLMLPDDAVAAYISYLAFGRPLVRKLMGTDPVPGVVRAVAQEPFPPSDEVTVLQPAVLSEADGRPLVRPLAARRNATLVDLVGANVLTVLPPRIHPVGAGEWVDVWPLGQD